MGKVHASLFSGFGAADLAATWIGWDNAFWCEIEDFPRTVLSYWFPKSKGYGNIKETDFTSWRGKIDVLTGGFPCQPFSVAGQRKGADDDRYLWPEMLRAIREIRPAWIVGENVAGILSMVQPGNEVTVESQASLFEEADKETLLEQEYIIETVCKNLEQEGYKVQPIVIPACAVSAPHRRDRVFFIARRDSPIVADTKSNGSSGTSHECREAFGRSHGGEIKQLGFGGEIWSSSYPDNNGCDSTQIGQGYRKRDHDYTSGEEAVKQLAGCRCQTDTPNTNGIDGDFSGFCTSRLSQLETTGLWPHSDTDRIRFQKHHLSPGREEPRLDNRSHHERARDWRNFPTQSPVCRGNDGLPFDVVRLTISLTAWCTGSIKGYGNAIVPQVMYEIFRAIEESEK